MKRSGTFDNRRRYDWSKIQHYYDEGNSIRKCMYYFGFSRGAWHKAIKRGEFKTRPNGRPVLELLAVAKSRANVKRRLLAVGLLENRCQECGLSEWLGEPLTIQIDHINGLRDDHRLENLRMLCPNCHSQTDTYGQRNSKRYLRLQDPGEVM